MNVHKYLIEKAQDISSNDLLIFRSFYGPILGSNAISVYQYLCDMGSLNYGLDNVINLMKFLRLDIKNFDKSRKLLESLGLITTYEDVANLTYIFSIKKPLPIDEFISNKLLFNLLKKNIGDLYTERLVMNFKGEIYDKSEFQNVSAKYHDNFNVNNLWTQNIQNTLDINIPNLENIDEAIEKLSVFQFVRYLTDCKPTITQTMSLNNFLATGLSDASINVILEYSFNVNGKIVYKHVSKIIDSFSHGKTKSFYEIKKKLKIALSNKTFNISKSTSYDSPNLDSDESMDDVFNDLQLLL